MGRVAHLVFAAWYGTGRIVEDFFRIDVTHGTGLTGSQWASLVVVLASLWVLLVRRRTPAWGDWSPPSNEDASTADALPPVGLRLVEQDIDQAGPPGPR